jgi:ABC-type Zn uptake system ZnuABC Zn-binding protein ZnuA
MPYMRWSALWGQGRRLTLWRLLSLLAILSLVLVALTLGKKAVRTTAPRQLQVVVTSNIISDLVEHVGKDRVQVHSLLRPGVDPHTYQPVPADLRAIAKAQLVVVHGLGLDSWATRLIQSSGTKARVISATEGVPTRLMEEGQPDPHCWLDPNLVRIYVGNIATALEAADPAGSATYQQNASAFDAELEKLDGWVRASVAQLPAARRKLVTNHDAFAYFAARYGFRVVGTIIPSLNPEAEPSARQLSLLIETIREEGVRAIFTEDTLPKALAETIASQVGHTVRVVRLYTGSLSEVGGAADTYLKLIRFNTQAIVDGLL